MVAMRNSIVKHAAMLKNQLHQQLSYHYSFYKKFFCDIDGKAVLVFWDKYPAPHHLASVGAEELAESLRKASYNTCSTRKAAAILELVKEDGATKRNLQEKRDFLVVNLVHDMRRSRELLLNKIYSDEREEIEDIILKLYQNGNHQVITYLPKFGLFKLIDGLSKLPIPSLLSAEYAKIQLDETGDSHYEDLLIDHLSINNKMERNIVVRLLLSCKPSHKLDSPFEDLIFNDNSSLVRFNAAAGLLYCRGIINNPLDIDNQHPYRHLIVGLSSDNVEERKTAFVELTGVVYQRPYSTKS